MIRAQFTPLRSDMGIGRVVIARVAIQMKGIVVECLSVVPPLVESICSGGSFDDDDGLHQ